VRKWQKLPPSVEPYYRNRHRAKFARIRCLQPGATDLVQDKARLVALVK